MKIEQKHFDALLSKQRCEFWDVDDRVVTGILSAIDIGKIHKFGRKNGGWYRNCEPLKTKIYLKPIPTFFKDALTLFSS